MNRWLFLPNGAIQDLRALSDLSDEAVEQLQQALELESGPNSRSTFLRIGEIVSLADQDAASFYYFWDYVQEQRKENHRSAADAISEFVAFLRSKPLGAEQSKEQKLADIAKRIWEKRLILAKLFGDFPRRELAEKVKSLELGPLPHLTGIRTFCDVRPVFDKAGVRISNFLPTLVLRIRAHGFPDEHKEMIVQLTEKQLSGIESEFQRLRRKLNALRERFPELLPEQTKKRKSKIKGA